jgi:hypothetical protein
VFVLVILVALVWIDIAHERRRHARHEYEPGSTGSTDEAEGG